MSRCGVSRCSVSKCSVGVGIASTGGCTVEGCTFRVKGGTLSCLINQLILLFYNHHLQGARQSVLVLSYLHGHVWGINEICRREGMRQKTSGFLAFKLQHYSKKKPPRMCTYTYMYVPHTHDTCTHHAYTCTHV